MEPIEFAAALFGPFRADLGDFKKIDPDLDRSPGRSIGSPFVRRNTPTEVGEILPFTPASSMLPWPHSLQRINAPSPSLWGCPNASIASCSPPGFTIFRRTVSQDSGLEDRRFARRLTARRHKVRYNGRPIVLGRFLRIRRVWSRRLDHPPNRRVCVVGNRRAARPSVPAVPWMRLQTRKPFLTDAYLSSGIDGGTINSSVAKLRSSCGRRRLGAHRTNPGV